MSDYLAGIFGCIAFVLWHWNLGLRSTVSRLEDERDKLAYEIVRLAGDPADEGNHLA